MGPGAPVLGLVAVLAACFSPQAAAGLPCAPPGADPRCPLGQVCVARDGVEVCDSSDDRPDAAGDAGIDPVPDARIDASAGVDTDGDGVLDPDDNCVGYANPDQADEDSDGAGDICDPCPPYGDNSDPDGDAVGGPCDPDPLIPGNAIVAFAGFSTGLPTTGWTVTGSIAVDTMTGEAEIAVSPTEAVLATTVPGALRMYVSAEVTPTSFVSTIGGIGVIQRRGATETGVACQLVTASTGMPLALRLYDLDLGTTIDEGSHPVVVGTKYGLALGRDGGDFLCDATSPALELSATSPASGMPGASAGLRVRNAGARYAWVLIVSGP